MQGADTVQSAHVYDEILLSYAGIIRIRFLGMISATVTRSTPANISAKINRFFISLSGFTHKLITYETV